jgi:hypothetical protein
MAEPLSVVQRRLQEQKMRFCMLVVILLRTEKTKNHTTENFGI